MKGLSIEIIMEGFQVKQFLKGFQFPDIDSDPGVGI